MTVAPERRWSYSLRTLFVVVTIMGIVLMVSGKWPVTEVISPYSKTVTRGKRQLTIRAPQLTITRPPTASELAMRAGISFLVVVLAFALIGGRPNRTPAPPQV